VARPRGAATSEAPGEPRPKAGGFFPGTFLTQLEQLDFLSRRTHIGRVKGERKSPRRGSSVEFADYRAYEVGDDLRYVDWNAFGRLDRLYLKVFMDEEDLCVHLLLDASASMDFGHPAKFDYVARLAAALAFVGFVNLERVGVGVFRGSVTEGWLPTRGRSQYRLLETFLRGLRPGGPTNFNDALRQYALRAKDSGLAVVISDFLDPGGYEAGLRALMERRFDIHVIHVLAPEELEPPLGGDLELVDVETGEVREVTVDAEARRAYERRLEGFLAAIEGFCRSNEISYFRASTEVPLEDLVLRRLKGVLLE
jgi:uncharacterized protein (DUF58 family)